MPLKAMHDTLDEIPEAHRELYREQNGVYPRVYGGTQGNAGDLRE